MEHFKNNLENIDLNSSKNALCIMGFILFISLLGTCYLLHLNLEDPILSFMFSLISSIIGVIIAVYFINYNISKNKKTLKNKYLNKIKGIFSRALDDIYTDINKIKNKERIILCKQFPSLKKVYKEKLFQQTAINARVLPERFIIKISKILERLDSLELNLILKKDQEIKYNIKKINYNIKLLKEEYNLKMDLVY